MTTVVGFKRLERERKVGSHTKKIIYLRGALIREVALKRRFRVVTKVTLDSLTDQFVPHPRTPFVTIRLNAYR